MEEKNERTNTDLGQLQAQERRSLWHFFTALPTFTGYRGRVFARNFHKATRVTDSFSPVGQPGLCRSTGLSSSSSFLCPTLISLTDLFCRRVLSPSLDCSLKLTDLFCWLTSSRFSRTFLSLVHFESRGRSRAQALCVGFAPKQTMGFSDWHPHPQKLIPIIVSHLACIYKEDLTLNNQQWLICHKTQPNQILYI